MDIATTLLSKSYTHFTGFRPANAGDVRDTGSVPGSGRSPGEGNGS